MRFEPPASTAMTLNLAPMVDVMMCLIIFFLLGSRFVDAQHKALELPVAVAAHDVDRSELGPRIVINVRPREDDDFLADYLVTDFDGQQIIERILTRDDIDDYVARRARMSGVPVEELRCVIRADQQVRYRHVEAVLRACGLAKIRNIVFSARHPTENGSAE